MLYYDSFTTAPLLYFNQIATTVGRLPEELARRVMRSADPEERARRLGGYILLERMVKRYTDSFKTAVEGIVKPEFGLMFDSRGILPAVHYDSYGKPYFEGHENAAFNLSHSRHLAACALNITPDGVADAVGIDVQMTVLDTERAERVAMRYFSEGEKELLYRAAGSDDGYCRLFTRIWTRKEALLKYWGVGLSRIDRADTTRPAEHGVKFIEDEINIGVDLPNDTHEDQSYCLTVCASAGTEIAPKAQ